MCCHREGHDSTPTYNPINDSNFSGMNDSWSSSHDAGTGFS